MLPSTHKTGRIGIITFSAPEQSNLRKLFRKIYPELRCTVKIRNGVKTFRFSCCYLLCVSAQGIKITSWKTWLGNFANPKNRQRHAKVTDVAPFTFPMSSRVPQFFKLNVGPFSFFLDFFSSFVFFFLSVGTSSITKTRGFVDFQLFSTMV